MIRSEEPDSFAAVSLAIAKIRLYVLKDQARSLGELAEPRLGITIQGVCTSMSIRHSTEAKMHKASILWAAMRSKLLL